MAHLKLFQVFQSDSRQKNAGAVQKKRSQALWGAGARRIMVFNVADLGKTATIRQSGESTSQYVTGFCLAYDQALEAALTAAAIPTIRLDAFAEGNRIASPEYGFTKVTDGYSFVGLPTGADPDQFYFRDEAHNTTPVHRLFADSVRNCLIDCYSPRNGKSRPPALVNALNGLVKKSN